MSDNVLIFDETKVIVNRNHEKYYIKYFIFRSPRPVKSRTDMKKVVKNNFEENDNLACFAQLKQLITKYKFTNKVVPNRILYECKFKNPPEKIRLKRSEINRWAELCKSNKLMPRNIGKSFVDNGSFCIKIDNISLELLYIYLSTARYIQEEPTFVRAILHMVDDLGMGFFTAFGVATSMCINNTGHHIIQQAKSYTLNGMAGKLNTSKDPKLHKFDLTYAAKLAKFLNSKNKSVTPVGSDKKINWFNTHNVIDKIKLEDKEYFSIVERNNLTKESTEKSLLAGKPVT